MNPSFQKMIDKTILLLNGGRTNVPQVGTLTSLTISPEGTIDNMVVEMVNGINTTVGPCIMEINSTLIYVSSWDTNTGVATVPPWGNGYMGTSTVTFGIEGTKVTINPLYFRWTVGEQLIDAISGLYPQLYAIGTQTLSSVVNAERYSLSSQAEELLSVKIEGFGPTNARREVRRRSLEVTGSSRVLNIQPLGLSGRPIIVKYRMKPALPVSPNDDFWVWSDSGLPTTAHDLPVLRAASNLALSSELAKLQMLSAEVSDRSRFVQAGTATSVSRRLKEEYDARLAEEQQALTNMNAYRPTLRYN